VDNVAVTFRHFSLRPLDDGAGFLAGHDRESRSIGALYNLTMDPYEKYDMVFNGAAPSRVLTSSPGRYTGEDNGWALSLIYPAIIDFDKSIIKYPNITRYVGGASTDLVPDLQHPDNPVPLLKDQIDRLHIGGNGG
jgi:arylsulfatase